MAKALLGVNSEIKTLEKDFSGQEMEVKVIEKKIREHVESIDQMTEEKF